jgi:hypothetical protein
MPFKHEEKGRAKYALTPLIDTVFLLLIFFLVTSYVGSGVITEQRLTVPTPLQREGEMNILIQLYETNRGELRAYYIDDSINGAYGVIYYGKDERFNSVTKNPGILTQRLFQVIEWDYERSFASLKNQLERLKDSRYSLFIGIRCPFDVPYFKIIELTSTLPKESRHGWPIRYGFMEGDRESLFKAVVRPAMQRDRVTSLLIDLREG